MGTIVSISLQTALLSLGLTLIVVAAFIVYFVVGVTIIDQRNIMLIERDEVEFSFLLLSGMSLFWLPASVPLSLALTLLHRRSRLVAYICGAPLVLVSALGFAVSTFAASLMVILATAAFSLPAWLALLVVKLRASR